MARIVRARTGLPAAGTVALPALAGSGCSSTTASAHGGGDCAWVVGFGGRAYRGMRQLDTDVRSPVHHQGKALGKGTLKGCDDRDFIGVSDPDHMPETVRRLLGIPPSPGPT